jgi:putative toxin-antitoxin system antitoxin component (TIGR02293 family)
MLYRKAGHAPHLSTAHEGGRFSIANEVAHRIVREGVTGQVLAPLGELLDLGVTQLAPVLGVDRATARRYARNDQALPMHSAETVLRLAELEALALDVFASEQASHGWLRKVHPLLGESPIDAASTSYGGQRVREMLIAIQHGGVA